MKKRKLDTNEFGKPNFIKNKRKYSRHNSSPSTSSSGLKVNILRKRQNIRVLDEREILPVGVPIPACKHGPCLLFSTQNGSSSTRWFACSVFRSPKRCSFTVLVRQDGTLEPYKPLKQISSLPIKEYGRVRKQFEELIHLGEPIFWCKNCTNYFTGDHDHNLTEPCFEWQEPSHLLNPLQDDAGEAQYFFSSETTELLFTVVQSEEADSILCIGVPTIFERLERLGKRVFLLDYDDRLSLFYPPDKFAQFSMLACHFFLPISRNFLANFFRNSKKVICLCDPPFGIHVAALMRTINSLREMFYAASNNNSSMAFNSILFLPYFIGKHLDNQHSLSMVDFKVTYSNHRDYSRSQKTVVRMFTDLPGRSFKLPEEKGYHFCEECDRFVAEANRHCWKCGECTSKDGTPYSHCDKCERCVRQKYKHCRKCDRCHLSNRCLRI